MRNRVLGRSVKRANEALAEAKLVALPEGLTLHALRRTFASVLVALGRGPAYVMGQMGHTDPTLTLALYAKVMSRKDEYRERLRQLVEGVSDVDDRAELAQSPEGLRSALIASA